MSFDLCVVSFLEKVKAEEAFSKKKDSRQRCCFVIAERDEKLNVVHKM